MQQNSQLKFKETELGLIPADWEVLNLGDVCTPVSNTYKLDNKEEIVFLNTGDIYDGQVLNHSKSSTKGLPGQAKKRIKKGDILYSEIRPANKRYAFVDFDAEEYVVSTKLMVLSPKANINPKYLLTFLSSPEILVHFQVLAESRSGTFPQITFDTIKNTPVPIPMIEEQRKIAEVLGVLNEKIELNRKMNKTLESIGQAIFKRWFVDFEFPNMEGKPYKSNGGEMVDSELGKMPGGWKIKKLNEIIELQGGLSYKGELITENGTPMITMGCTGYASRFNYSGLKYYLGEYNDKYVVSPGDLLLPTRDVTQERKILGCPIVVPNNIGAKIIFATNLYLVKNNSGACNEYLYQLFETNRFRERIIGSAKGTTIVMLTKDSVLGYRTIYPDTDTLMKYQEFTDPFLKKLDLLQIEIEILSQIRDSLLPRLMNGKLRVR